MYDGEISLIRECCRFKADSEAAAGKISPGINWAYFLHRANDERVSAILYKAIADIPDILRQTPGNIFQALTQSYDTILARNILAYQVLEDILQAFGAEKIPAITFKGLALGDLVYGDIGVRPFGDFDILVKKKDAGRSDRILKRFGYANPLENKPIPLDNPFRNSILYNKLDAYPKHVHLYWHIVNLYHHNRDIMRSINMDKIWQDSVKIRLGQIEARTFSFSHQLIYLCIHALTHAYKPLILLCDIDRLIAKESGNIEWDAMIREAYDFGVSADLYYGLYFSAEILNTDVPRSVLTGLKPSRISLYERKFISCVLEGREISHGDSLLMYIGMNRSLKDKFGFIKGALSPSPAEMAVIRQKEKSLVNFLDYLRRALRALSFFFRLLFKFGI